MRKLMQSFRLTLLLAAVLPLAGVAQTAKPLSADVLQFRAGRGQGARRAARGLAADLSAGGVPGAGQDRSHRRLRDLLDEVAQAGFNLKLEYIQSEYAGLISGVEADRFDVASGGISDTEEREQKLDFVNYMQSGGSIMVLSANTEKLATIDDFCGKGVATMLGGRTIMTAVEAASERCTKAGKPAIRAEQLVRARLAHAARPQARRRLHR